MGIAVPSEVIAAGWLPFTAALLLVLGFSFSYIRCYQSRYDKELCSTVTAILGLVVALLTCALVPVDIFLASFMKTSDGTFKTWASDHSSRESIENSVAIAYYVLYSLMILFLFIILPFAYFYYEEHDEEYTWRTKCCTSVKYTAVFLIMAIVLFVIGAFVPFRTTSTNNSTDSPDWWNHNNTLFDMTYYRAETALYFIVSALAVVGVLLVAIYTASGMSCWPVSLLKGSFVAVDEFASSPGTRRHMNSPLLRQPHRCWRRCLYLLRPVEMLVGVILLLLSLLIALTLLLSNIDKILNSLGLKMSYILTEPKLPNPIDISLVVLQKVFPLDYVLLAALIMFLFFCSMDAVRNIGIWFCWIKMYKIRVERTKPQALLFLCFILMLIVLALNVFSYQLAPQYMTYGSQHYAMNDTISGNVTTVTVKICSPQAPPGECVPTRVSVMLYQVFFRFWFFGVIYYWAMWAFLLVFILAFVVTLLRSRSSSSATDSDDEFGSDDELVHNS